MFDGWKLAFKGVSNSWIPWCGMYKIDKIDYDDNVHKNDNDLQVFPPT